MLADTPAMPTKRAAIDPNWQKIKDHAERRIASNRAWRSSWLNHWALLTQYILPRRSLWLAEGGLVQPSPNAMIRGQPINQSIVDPTGTQAMRICAAGMMSGLMSPSRPWFKLRPGMDGVQLDRDGQLWFDQVEESIYRCMAQSNFYDAAAQMLEDLVTFGTAPMLIYEDPKDLIRCYNPVVGEYYLIAGASFRVEGFARMFTLTISQMVEMFGLDNCPEEVQDLWAQKGASLENERIVAHLIEPNFPINDGAADPADLGVVPGAFAWREYYWCWGLSSNKPLSRRGFRSEDAPFIAPRWATTANDPYGRSVGMDVLPDIMQLQLMTKRMAEAIEKLVRPPMLADITMKNQPASILPGHVTYAPQLGPDKGMRPVYQVNPQVAEMNALIKEIQGRIQKGFFNDMFMMLTQMEGVQPRNEMEIAERKAEKMQVLGPVIEKFQTEAAGPAIKRIFTILQRRGVLPPVPDSLKNVPIEIDYVSMLTLAQRAAITAGMERVISTAIQLDQIYGTSAQIDGMEYVKEYADRLAFPNKILLPVEEAKKAFAQRQQALQQQQQGAEAMAAAPVAADTAKTLSDTDMGGGLSALQLMLGTPQ